MSHEPENGEADAGVRRGRLSEDRKRLVDLLLRNHAGEERDGEREEDGRAETPPPAAPPRSSTSAHKPFPDPGDAGPAPSPRLVRMKPGGDRAPFFCVHALLGSVFPYQKLAMHMPDSRPFYGIEAAGLDGKEKPLEDVVAMAASYLRAIESVRPSGPIFVGGYSFGGFVAYEIARLAREKGRAAPFVGMLGVGAPPTALPGVAESFKFAFEYWESFQKLVRNTVQAERAAGAAMPDPDAALASLTPMQRVTLANTVAQAKYVPGRREGDVDVFLTPEQRALSQADPRLGFGALVTGQVRTHELKCNHLAMFEEPHVSELAEALTRRLEEEEARLS